jgi:hypothetical protein
MHSVRKVTKEPCWWQLRRFVLEGRLVMTKLSRAVIACISATTMLLGVAPIAEADTFTYELNGSLMDSGGPSLVSQGGTLGSTGYAFGVNEGLSLYGTRAFDVYSIDIRFYFDNIIGASAAPYQRILEFKNRQSDSGLYSTNNGELVLFATSGTNDPSAASLGLERERGAGDQGEAAGPVVPVAGDKPHARRVAPHQHSEAVVFDFVQPPGPSGRLIGWAGQAGFAEVGKGYATQQHGAIFSAGRGPVQ